MGRVIRCAFIAAVVAALGVAATPVARAQDAPPLALRRIRDSAAVLFDAARTGNWSVMSAPLADMGEALSMLPRETPYPDVVAQLRERVVALRREVRAHRMAAVMNDANHVTRLVAQISDGFVVHVPFEVAVLPYYGRQLQVGVMRGRMPDLRRTTTDLRGTWDAIEPAVLQRGAMADARAFTDIVVQLEGARQVKDFAAPASAEIREAAKLNQLFETHSP